jgi:glycosyltransferase involved in cell wall biosynthesis
MKKRLLYFVPNNSTFIQRDIDLLSKDFEVRFFNLRQGNKLTLLPRMGLQCLFILKNSFSADIFICHFAGYASFLPVLLGRLFSIPCIIIVAGADASRFPVFNYGNFAKQIYAFFTSVSLRFATHILPVHESLVFQQYDYDPAGEPAQGYQAFAKKTDKVPFTPVYYGYDSNQFKPVSGVVRKDLSFITVGNMSNKDVFVRKGFDLIIELAKRRKDLSFTLVGWSGKQMDDIPENLSLLPFMNQDELIRVLSEHTFYFQLSVMEGFPNALCEAMLCGCVPIGSNVSGIPFIIGDTGFLLRKRNVIELEMLVNKAIDSGNLPMLSEKARQRIANHFSYELRRKRLNNIIDQYTNQI